MKTFKRELKRIDKEFKALIDSVTADMVDGFDQNRVGELMREKKELQKKFADAQGLEFPLIADTETTLLQQLGCWGEKVACGRRTIGTLRTTYLVNEEGIIEKIFTPKEIKTKIHAEQILECEKIFSS